VEASRAELAAMLGLPEEALGDTPLWVDTGSEQLVIPIVSSAQVRAARPDLEALHQHGNTPSRKEALAYLWARPTGDETEHTVRFFFTSNGAVVEDPATGSACANLGGWHVATGAPLPLHLTLRQGEAVQRPSRLVLRVESDGAIFVSGTVHELARGTLEL
jgi:PhzF family phenazine biosynthesis protein